MTFLLHNIKTPCPTANYNSPEQVRDCIRQYPDADWTFDGVYETVFRQRELFAALSGKKILFPVGSHVGGDNSFDTGQPVERFCDWGELIFLAGTYGFEIGWHTWTHRDLTMCDEAEIIKEITPPAWLNVTSFAYPYGRVNPFVAHVVAHSGLYRRAYGAANGTGQRWNLQRRHLP